MSRYVLSPRAQADLDGVWDYTAETWGVDQAERYIQLIAGGLAPWLLNRRAANPATISGEAIANMPLDRMSYFIGSVATASMSSAFCISRWILSATSRNGGGLQTWLQFLNFQRASLVVVFIKIQS